MRSWMEDRCNPRRVAGKSEHSIYFDKINSSFPNKCLLLLNLSPIHLHPTQLDSEP